MKAIAELCKLYSRLQNCPESGMSDTGYQERLLYYKIHINARGDFCRLEALTHDSGGKRVPGAAFMCPVDTPRGSNVAANLGYDKPEYLFGFDAAETAKPKHLAAWLDLLRKYGGDGGVADACLRFYDNLEENIKKLRADPVFPEYIRNSLHPWATFELDGGELLISAKKVKELAAEAALGGEPDGVCMVTGKEAKIAETHPSFNLGAFRPSLVAINTNKGFDSPGGEHGFNSPMSKRVAYEYTQALKYLLARQDCRIACDNVTFVYWGESRCKLETSLNKLVISQLGNNWEEAEANVRELCGGDAERDVKFYILGMTPNQRRVIIRTWIETTVGEICDNVLLFLRDRHLGKVVPSILAPLKYFTSTGEFFAADANLLTRYLESVLLGGFLQFGGLSQLNTQLPKFAIFGFTKKLPATFPNLPSLLVGLLKLILNRNYNQGHAMQIDEDIDHKGYLCGRLFATYVKVYEETTPKGRYFDAIMATANLRPAEAAVTANAVVEACIRDLSAPRRIYFQKLIQQLHSKIGQIPQYLADQDAAAFLMGYYHQRDEFFKKHEE